MTSPPPPANDALAADRLARRIANGESPQSLLAQIVAAPDELTFTELLSSLRVLIANGARVATGERDCAFETLIRNPVFLTGLLFSDVMSSLLVVPGEVPLHILARDAPGVLFSRLGVGVSPGILAGLHNVDAQGRTPSHWLWAPDGQLVQYANQACNAPDWNGSKEDTRANLWLGVLEAAWKTQALLEDHGLSMDIPDAAGITAMDLCIARLKADDAVFLPGYDVCARVNACMIARRMTTDTPLTETTPIAGPRF